MTHRNIELQVALPKVTEVTKIQQQLQQQHMNQQATFEQAMNTKVARDAHRTQQSDESRAVSNGRQHSGQTQDHRENEGQPKEDHSQQEAPHPFKGQHIDIRL